MKKWRYIYFVFFKIQEDVSPNLKYLKLDCVNHLIKSITGTSSQILQKLITTLISKERMLREAK
jgi:hypothetical protein